LPTQIAAWTKTINDAIDVAIADIRNFVFHTLAQAPAPIAPIQKKIADCITAA
jgi:hypothetical protein